MGVGAVTVALVAPFVLAGATTPMTLQTVVAPLADATAGRSVADALDKMRGMLGLARYLAVLGAWGGLIAAVRQMRRPRTPGWLVAVVIGWFLFQALVVDLDARPDLVPFVVFAGPGVGLLVDSVAPAEWTWRSPRKATPSEVAGALSLLCILLILGKMTLDHLPWMHGNVASPPGVVYNPMKELYWSGKLPESCHVRLSGIEREWLRATGSERAERICSSVTLDRLRELLL